MDGVTFAAVEAGGVEAFLDQLRGELVQRIEVDPIDWTKNRD